MSALSAWLASLTVTVLTLPARVSSGGDTGSEGQDEPVPDSSSLRYAVYVWVAYIVAQVLDILVGLASLNDAGGFTGPNGRSADVDHATAVVFGAAGIVVGALVVAVIGGWIVRQVSKGRNWARITSTVYGVLVLIVTATSFGSGVTIIASVVIMLLLVTAIVLMYTPDSNRYIRAQ